MGASLGACDEAHVDLVEAVLATEPGEQAPPRAQAAFSPGRSPVSTNVIRLRIAAVEVDAHLGGWRRRRAANTADPHPVGTVVGELDRVEAGDDVGVEVLGRADLVEQLRGDGADVDQAAGAGVLGDDRRAVAATSAIGKPGGSDGSGISSKKRVVAAGGLGAALDDVAGDDGAGQRVPVVECPVVPPRRRPDHE